MKISKAQILHVLTVLVVTPVAAVIPPWLAKHFPGLPGFSAAQLTAFGVAGATAALTLGLHYLHGWQVWERLEATGAISITEGETAGKLDPPLGAPGDPVDPRFERIAKVTPTSFGNDAVHGQAS